MAQLPLPLGTTLAGKYRLERVIGEGGMGVVVLAHHLELDQPVAIKFLLAGVIGSDGAIERFRREARAAAKVQSEHVVRVYDVGTLESGDLYMVMEYLRGRDLHDELGATGPLTVERLLALADEVLDALVEAHSAGIVHRDLKPANLFLTERAAGKARVKVLDFGISKVMEGASSQMSLTRTAAWVGSPLYMAPEQMRNAKDVDARADIWSLGAILYEALAGEVPYPADSLPELCSKVLTMDPLPLHERRPDVPRELSEVIHRCLAKDLSVRFGTAQELRDALGRVAMGLSSSGVASALTVMLPAKTWGGEKPNGSVVSTTSAWESRPDLSLTQEPQAAKKRWLPIGLGLVAVAAAVFGWFAMGGASPAPAPMAPHLPATQPASPVQVAPPAPAPPAAQPEILAEVPQPPSAPTEAGSPDTAPGADSPVAPAEPKSGASVGAPPPKPRPSARPKTQEGPSRAPDGVSDFGGRR